MKLKMKKSPHNSFYDYLGITGSTLCLIHCIATPIILMTGIFRNEHLKVSFLSLDYVFILLNVFAVYHATRHHADTRFKWAFWSLLILFSGSLLLEDFSEVFKYLGYLSSFGLVVTHVLNIRICRIHLHKTHQQKKFDIADGHASQ